jgi:hypothetical protein
LVPAPGNAQVNSGSDGHDGAFNPTQNVEIDMADHSDGIYHYTTVNIPAGVTVTFKPNANNSPVVWLVQGDCVISGRVNVAGSNGLEGSGQSGALGGLGGPGGWKGGSASYPASDSGQGPGGGGWDNSAFSASVVGSGGSFATLGEGPNPGQIYGNSYLLPLVGGSGGGGKAGYAGSVGMKAFGGAGGGGAILIAASALVRIDGGIEACGGGWGWGGGGSGGGIRIVSTGLTGTGVINAAGGGGSGPGGSGRIRIDVYETTTFAGTLAGSVTKGFQPIIIPAAGQGVQLSIASIAGTAVSQNPSGLLANPDVIIPSQQSNPIPIVVNCSNIPLNTEISVVVRPANSPEVQAVATNNVGTLAASTATVSLNMPRGGGIIYAKCVSGVAGEGAETSLKELRTKSLAETGWTADGERFAKMEIAAALGGSQQITYITESGKRYPLAIR